MFNFRKRSVTFKQQFCTIFQNEKKLRKHGMTECANFEFRQKDDELKRLVDLRDGNKKNEGYCFDLCSYFTKS